MGGLAWARQEPAQLWLGTQVLQSTDITEAGPCGRVEIKDVRQWGQARGNPIKQGAQLWGRMREPSLWMNHLSVGAQQVGVR